MLFDTSSFGVGLFVSTICSTYLTALPTLIRYNPLASSISRTEPAGKFPAVPEHEVKYLILIILLC